MSVCRIASEREAMPYLQGDALLVRNEGSPSTVANRNSQRQILLQPLAEAQESIRCRICLVFSERILEVKGIATTRRAVSMRESRWAGRRPCGDVPSESAPLRIEGRASQNPCALSNKYDDTLIQTSIVPSRPRHR